MIDFPFCFGNERTAFSDECYAVVGRALAFAQRFEGDCRALAGLIKVKTVHQFSLDSNEDYESLSKMVVKLWHRMLKQQIESLSQYFDLNQDAYEVLRKGREARNIIAHDIALGLEHEIETDDGREKIIKEVETQVHKIAEADRIVCFLTHIATNELLPDSDYIRNYCDKVVNWVCEVEDDY